VFVSFSMCSTLHLFIFLLSVEFVSVAELLPMEL
jgi:hypothetical protein